MTLQRKLRERLYGAPVSVTPSCRLLGAAAMLIALIACSPEPGAGAPEGDVVATFKGGQITHTELLGAGLSSGPVDSAALGDESVDWRIETINDLAFRKTLAAEDIDDLTVVEAQIDTRRNVALVELMVDRLGWNSLTVTEEEARRQYDSHPEQYQDPEKARLQHIYMAVEADEATEEEQQAVRERLETVRAQLLAGADFTAMAREYSESSTAKRGGWLGINRGENVDSAFTSVAWSIELDTISEIIETPHGYHVLAVRERHPPLVRDFASARKFAFKRALADKRAELERLFVKEKGPHYGLEKDYEPLLDPLVTDQTALITIGTYHFTVSDLVRNIEPKYLEHFYNGYLPEVYVFLDRTALESLLVLEAEELGLQNSPEFVRTVETITRDVRYEATLEHRLQEAVASVPDATMREYFEQNSERYKTPRRTDLSLILLPGGDNLWKTFEQGRDLVQRIRAGESFEDLARRYSRHMSARNGGKMRGLDNTQLATQIQSGPKFRRAFNALQEGEVAEAIVAECYDPGSLRFMQVGVLVVRKDRIVEPEFRPYEEVEYFVRSNYLRRNYTSLFDELRRQVLAEIDLIVYEERLPGA